MSSNGNVVDFRDILHYRSPETNRLTTSGRKKRLLKQRCFERIRSRSIPIENDRDIVEVSYTRSTQKWSRDRNSDNIFELPSPGSIYLFNLSSFWRYLSSFVPRSWETHRVEPFHGEKKTKMSKLRSTRVNIRIPVRKQTFIVPALGWAFPAQYRL